MVKIRIPTFSLFPGNLRVSARVVEVVSDYRGSTETEIEWQTVLGRARSRDGCSSGRHDYVICSGAIRGRELFICRNEIE